MAVKVSRYLTHIRRLRDPTEPVSRLADRAVGLGDRLGPYLLQLPPTLRADAGLLDACLRALPLGPGGRRAPPRILVVRRGARRPGATAGGPVLGRPRRSSDHAAVGHGRVGYVRLHEGTASPRPSYGRAALATWLDRIAAAWPGAGRADVYVYFNNDRGGAAVRNARTFRRMADRLRYRVR